MNAFVSYVAYLKMMLVPTNLAVFYPHPFITQRVSVPLFVFAAAAVVAVSVLAVLKAGKARYMFTGWFWYLGLLVPVIGFIQVGDQALADRYTYLPAIGIAIVVAWAACGFLERYTRFRIAGAAIGVILTLGMVLGSRAQTATWKNDFVLFSHAINVTKDNYKMHYDLGIALRSAGDTKAALGRFLQAQKINGRDERVYMDISSIYMREGRYDEMIALCSELLAVNPGSWSGYYGRGIARLMKMQQDSAGADFATALRLKIDDVQALEQVFALAAQMKDADLIDKSGAALIEHYSRNGLPEKAEEVRQKLGESASSSAGAENPPLR
jgi:tetratricopeptide (TPR) repeat protein